MKKLLFIFSLYLFSLPLSAQSYSPFPDSNAVWRVDWAESACFLNSIPDAEYQYIMTGDTIIGLNTYSKIERSGVVPVSCQPPHLPANGYIGAIRQDTVAKKVFVVLPDSVSDMLLYDFNLNVGDTITGLLADISFCTGPNTPTISSIDSMTIGTGYRKVYHYTGIFCSGMFIEGIGNAYGLLEPLSDTEEGGMLICFIQNGVVMYPDILFPCPLANSISQIDNKNKLKVHPNPTTGKFTVKGATGEIEVYDLFGRLLLRSNKEEIDMSNYPAGLYIWRAGEARGKIVIE